MKEYTTIENINAKLKISPANLYIRSNLFTFAK